MMISSDFHGKMDEWLTKVPVLTKNLELLKKTWKNDGLYMFMW